jgi:uncharacterized protein (DUF362 family)
VKVYVGKTNASELKVRLCEALEWLGWEQHVRRSCRVFVKPNLTWREPVPGVTTTPVFIEAVVAAFKERTDNIFIGEADGGYHLFKAEEDFENHGLYELGRRCRIRLVNLSRVPAEKATVTVSGRLVTVELPSLLLHDVDVFVTLPVPKVHALTQVSLGFKNQWGCQPGTMRLRNHPEFARKILAINKLLRPQLAIYDGTYFLDKTGPMVGEPVRTDLVIAANDLGAGDLVCCEIMGIDPHRVRHLRLAQREGIMPRLLKEVALNQDLAVFQTHRFHLKRSLINWIALAAFHSDLLTRFFYDSIFAGPLHKVLYAIRKNPLVRRFLYGPIGPPRVEENH